MKKIVGAVLAATLAAGVATAEVTVKLDSATKMDFFNATSTNEASAEYDEFSIFTENKFTLDAKNEAGTVGLSFTPRFNSGSMAATDYVILGSAIMKKDDGTAGTAGTKADPKDNKEVKTATTDGLFHRIEWNAFVKGKYAKVTVGNFDSRNANRVTGDAGKYHKWEMAKMGYSTFGGAKVGVNSTLGYSQNETDYIARAGNTNINAVGDLYFGPVTLQLAYRQKATAGDAKMFNKYFGGNWGLRVFGNVKDYVKLTATLTSNDDNKPTASNTDGGHGNTVLNFGAFAEISALKKVGTFVVGYSGGYALREGTKIWKNAKEDSSVHAINTRIQIPLLDKKLSITTHNDFTFATANTDKSAFSMMNLVSVTYKVGIFTPQIYFANNYESSDGNTAGAFILAPRCQVSLAKGANFYCSFEWRKSYSNVDGFKSSTTIQIPAVLHIAL